MPGPTDVNTEEGASPSTTNDSGTQFSDYNPTSETTDNSPDLGNRDEEAANALNAGGEDTDTTDDGQEPQSFAPVPYDRFKQKNEEWKTATARAAELERQLQERDEQLNGYREYDDFLEPVKQKFSTGAEFRAYLDQQAHEQNEAELARLAMEDVNKEIDAQRVDGDDEEAVADRREERLKVRRAEQFLYQQQEQNRVQQEQQEARQIQDTMKRALAAWKRDYPNLDEDAVSDAVYAKGDWKAGEAAAIRTHKRNLVTITNNPPQSTAPRNAQGVAAPTPLGAGNSAGVTKPDEWDAKRALADPEGWKAHSKKLTDAAQVKRLREQGYDANIY